MSIHNLDRMFKPSAIAVVVGRACSENIGESLIGNLKRGGFAGKIYLVSSRREGFVDLPSHPTIADVGEPVDLALIGSDLPAVPQVIRECAKAGIAGAAIFSDGLRLPVNDRTALDEEIKDAAYQGSVRIIGPGSSGVACTAARLAAIHAANLPLAGRLAFVSASRTISHAILDLSAKEKIGFSYVISTGDMLDVDFADYLNFLGNDPRVSSIALYLEKLTNFRKFMSAARAVSRIKPIVALKSGRVDHRRAFETWRRCAISGEDEIYSAAFKRAGIERVNTFAELFDCADLLAKQPRPSASRVVIVTNGRGPARFAADALADLGIELPSLNPETVQTLNDVLSPSETNGNPIDLGGNASPEKYAKVVEICLASPEVGALLVILVPDAESNLAAVAESLVEKVRNRTIPVCAVCLGAAEVERGREILSQSGIPTFETPERAIKAFQHMGSYSHNLKMLQEIPEKLPRDLEFDSNAARKIVQMALDNREQTLKDEDCSSLLTAYGIPLTKAEAAIQGYELMLGALKDPGFGPVLFCGAGGITGEIYCDYALALPPLNRVLARQLIEATRTYQLLKGKDGRQPANLELLEEVLIRLSQLVADLPEVVRLDINPLLLGANTTVALNARVVVERTEVASPMHLVISAYPSQYEMKTITTGGTEILLRPIRPEDAPLLVELFHSLSPTSVYFRFFVPMKEIPLGMLAKLSQIDYDRDIVMVASKETAVGEKILGVVRLMGDPDVTSAEFAIAVGDAWQKKGVGSALLERAIHLAREQGLQFIWGTVLAENKGMLAFARSHGFKVAKTGVGQEYEVRIDLRSSDVNCLTTTDPCN